MRSYPQQGVGGMDSRYLRRDGSVPLTGNWNVGNQQINGIHSIVVTSGGILSFGNNPNSLRFVFNADEILELLGVSNNQANLHLKNLRVEDLAGVGNRNVIADVNGDLSAP